MAECVMCVEGMFEWLMRWRFYWINWFNVVWNGLFSDEVSFGMSIEDLKFSCVDLHCLLKSLYAEF